MKLSEHLKPTLDGVKSICDQGLQATTNDVMLIINKSKYTVWHHFKELVYAGVLNKTRGESITSPAYFSLKIDPKNIEWESSKKKKVSEPKWKPPVRYSSVWDYAAQIKRSKKK